ncbi:FMN-binding protein [Sinomonas sp. R1AF57]|uniref:FMN-binding protein n=1 Tax=Sinomonas sp. R1AF57 TaxID=2020377 RepID=UPI001ABF373F|nr:FMN-binding protein [Sinomonas sp. R1AF57]
MRTRAAISASLASVGILAAGWQAGAQALDAAQATAAGTGTGTTTGTATSGTGSTTAGGTSGATGGSTSSGASSSGSTSGQATTGAQAKAQATYAGKVVSTRFGTVQVQITVQNGKITDVTALKLTDAERKSQMISSQAAPILRSEVLRAQSADVQTVSGATVTSDAYLTSLQAALDAAHL